MVRCLRHLACHLVAIATLTISCSPAAETESARAAGAHSQRAAAGWLRLQRDQWDAGQQVAPITRAESARRESLERQDAIRLRETFMQEERELQTLRRAERQTSQTGGQGGLDDRAAERRIQGRLIQQQQAREGQRLRMRTERRVQAPSQGLKGWGRRAE